jgi:dynactin complex subunit
MNETLMNETIDPITRLLRDIILPNLKSVQVSQSEQIAANDRLENAMEELRLHLESQFAHLSAQLTACRAELAATQATFKAVHTQNGTLRPDRTTLIH